MLTQPTIEKLRLLKLTGMADAFAEQIEKPLPDLDFEARLGLLVDREQLLRDNKRLKRRLSQAKLPQPTCIEEIDYEPSRGINKANIIELSKLHWVRQHQNMLITGKTGCGKTYIACAIAHKACMLGFTARYFRLPRLWHEMKIAKANGTYTNLLKQFAKLDVIILDDWGIAQPDLHQRQDLLEILEDRYQLKSTIVTSQLPVSHWHEHLSDETLADAILDRLVHNSIRIDLRGESMRKNKKSLQIKKS